MTVISQRTLADHQEQLLEELGYQWSVRDEGKILDTLRNKGEVDAMYFLETATAVDEFFYFLRELGIWQRLEGLTHPGQQRKSVSLFQLILMYFLKTLAGIEGLHALPELLFAQQGLMRLLGFNGRQLKEGLSHRGDHCRKGEKRSLPLCPDVIRKQLVQLPLQMVADFFNHTIQALARYGAYGRKVRGQMDATPLITTAKAKDAGCITQQKSVRTKSGELRQYEVKVYGWKMTTLWDANSGLPIAVCFGKINQGDRQFTLDVITQAKQNLAGSGSKLHEVVFDGGYLDGEDFYQLNQQGLIWLTRGAVSLDVVEEAMELARSGNGVTAQRTETVTRGKGKQAMPEELHTCVVGVSDLCCFNTYAPPGGSPNRVNRRNFDPARVNAVVVEKWKGEVPSEPEVYLTNGSVTDPLATADKYDQRSEIENRLHREAKQSYHLEHLLQKSEAGAYVHVYLVMSLYALVRAFRTWVREEETNATKGRGSSLQSFRAKIASENRDLVIIFVEAYYAIIALADLMSVVGGVKFKEQTPIQSWDEIYLKYTGHLPLPP